MTSVKLNEAPLSSAQETLHLLAGVPGGEPGAERSVTWADLVRREQEALARDAERAAAWWREHLAGTPDLTLPSDRPRPPRPSFRSEVVRVRCEPGLGRALRELARAE